MLEQAAAQGQAIFAGSGDDGSEDCYDPPFDSDASLAVDYPASSPWVTAVGGTSLSLDGTEVVWNGCLGVLAPTGCGNEGGGGGGVSTVEAKPVWQSGLLTPAGVTCGGEGTNCREVPDVSANAGVPVVFYAGGQWGAFTGTSIAAPMVAGLWADRQSACVHPAAGDAAATLYQVAADGGVGTGLYDITQGENDFTQTNGGQYGAGPGYDLASGLGSPIAAGPRLRRGHLGRPEPGAGRLRRHGERSRSGPRHHQLRRRAGHGRVRHGVLRDGGGPAGSGTVNVSATSSLGNGSATALFTYGTPVGAFTRVYGTTAIGTAIAISQARFPASDSVPAVVVARSDFFSDALAGGPLAARVGGPLLITPGASLSSTLDPTVLSEIERVLEPGGTVYLLGGPLALSPTIDPALESLGYTVDPGGRERRVRDRGRDRPAAGQSRRHLRGDRPQLPRRPRRPSRPPSTSTAPSCSPTAPPRPPRPPPTWRRTPTTPATPSADRWPRPAPTRRRRPSTARTSTAPRRRWPRPSSPRPRRSGPPPGTNFPDGLAAGPGLGLADAPLLLVEPTGALPPTVLAYLQAAGGTVTAGTLFGGPLAVTDQVLAELDGAV